MSTFWAHGEAPGMRNGCRGQVEAFEAGLALLRKKRSDEARQLVLSLVEALGAQHPRSASARRWGKLQDFLEEIRGSSRRCRAI